MGRMVAGGVLLLLSVLVIIDPGRMDSFAIAFFSIMLGLPGALLAYFGWRAKFGPKSGVLSAMNELLALYNLNRDGFAPGFGSAKARDRVRQIGRALDEAGGMNLMLEVHGEFAKRIEVQGAARNLEHTWDGIGEWRG